MFWSTERFLGDWKPKILISGIQREGGVMNVRGVIPNDRNSAISSGVKRIYSVSDYHCEASHELLPECKRQLA